MRKPRPIPKGRAVDAKALAEVQALLGDESRQRDLLIEHLHKINDRYGHLAAAHLAALAQEMRLALTEVYEVATFYHHFEVVKEGERAAAGAHRARVRLDLVRARGGAGAAEETFVRRRRARDSRAVRRPLRGRALRRRAPERDRQCHAWRASRPQWTAKKLACAETKYIDYAQYRKAGGYKLIADCLAGKRTREDLTKIMEDSGLRGLGGAGFPAGRKWRLVAAERGPRVMAVNIDEGEPGTFKDRWYLERDPHRFLEGMLVAAWCAGVGEIWIYLRDEYAGCRAILETELTKLQREAAVCAAADSSAPGRGRLHLRRRVGDDRVDRRQARHAAPAPALRRAGRPLRPPDARAQHGDGVLGARDRREGRAMVRRAGAQRPQRTALVLGVGTGEEARRAPRAGGHHRARADRGVLRRHAGRARVLCLPSRRRLGRHPAGLEGRHPARLRHAAAARLLHRFGGRGHL